MIRSSFRVAVPNSSTSRFSNGFTNTVFSYSTNTPNQNNQEHANNENSKKTAVFQFLKKAAFLFCTGVIGGFLGYVVFGQEDNKQQISKNSSIAEEKEKAQGIKIGGPWRLIDSQQKAYSSEDLAGSYYLIYFGYALCPDVCPTTLKYLSNVHRHLNSSEQGKRINLRTVFVSVDPKRDTPQKIAEYVKLFDGSIMGLTGKDEDDEDYRRMLDSFKVYANKIKGEQGKSYNIDHTSIVYLMGPQSQFVGSINPSKTQRQTAQQLIHKITAHKAERNLNSEAL